MTDKMKQEAGNNSQLVQAQTINCTIQREVSKEEAKKIVNELFVQKAQELTSVARETASKRTEEFGKVLIPRIEKIENTLASFSDPEFQILLGLANKTAMQTDNVDEYKLLSELLAHKIQKHEDKKIGTGINRAIQIVNEIDTDSLLSLSMYFAVSTFTPMASDVSKALSVMDDLFSKIMQHGLLPTGTDWMDQLDVLGCARISDITSPLKLEDIYLRFLKERFACGFKKDSDIYVKAMGLLSSNALPSDVLVPNEFDPNYCRLSVTEESQIDKMKLTQFWMVTVDLTKEQKEVLHQIFHMYTQNPELQAISDSSIRKKFIDYQSIQAVSKWWNQIPHSMQITSVGKVLAYTNIKRIIPDIPPLY